MKYKFIPQIPKKCAKKSRIDTKNKNIVVYPDPSARQRKTSAGGFTDISILKNAGFDVRCRNTAPMVRDRINSVNSRLKNVNGKNSLFIVKSCKNVIKSIERQIYKEGNSHTRKRWI